MHEDIHDDDLHSLVRQTHATVNRLDRLLTGGSEPKQGMIVRMDRLEQDSERNKETARNARGVAWAALTAGATAAVGWFFGGHK